MGPVLVNGLPSHVLLVRVVVVLVPLTALSLVACAVWPSVMRRFGLALFVIPAAVRWTCRRAGGAGPRTGAGTLGRAAVGGRGAAS